MNFFRVKELAAQEVLPGVQLRSVHMENLTMTFVEYAPGSSVPAHHHRHEQITFVLEGRLELTIAGECRVVEAGEGVRIGPNVEHSSRPVGGAASAVDAWTPMLKHFANAPLATLGHRVPIEGESVT
jgi:quercetin dioxygenase-like cupin family protein